jgi:ribonucleotide reductase alpha subunit
MLSPDNQLQWASTTPAQRRRKPMNPATQPPTSEQTTAGVGLKIKRLFTSPDTHPFDAIEWERRDARIGHGDRVAFEQSDVEFPKSWSQNATNIVAQKYFRGQLGSPERESSVKEMISRVAGTISRWGREGNYFASEEDARAFNHELTHILVNQMAAFNSPVWFNVGFEESPQCSACLPYHALVSTPDGMVSIGEIVENEEIGRAVYDANGITHVLAVKDNGRKPVWRVKLRNGSFIEATPDHVVKVVSERGAAPQWLRVDELKPGVRLHLHPHRAKVTDPIRVAAGAGGLEAGNVEAGLEFLNQTDRVAVAEAALAGWLQADGFVGQYATGTNRSLTIEFQVASDDEFDWIIENLDIVFPDVHHKVREADTKETRVRRIRLYGEVLREYVERWDLLDRGTEMRVPARLFTSSHDEIVAYLRSLFQADGYVSVRRDHGCENARVGFAVIGERWTEDVQLLLGTLGIYSRRTHKREKRAGRHDLHEVSISIGSERARFAELIGFVGGEKQERLFESLNLRNPKRCADLRQEEIVSIEHLGEMNVYDIQTGSNEFLTNNIAIHNCFILSVDDTMESILDWNTKEGMIFRGGSGSGINLSNIRGSMEPLAKGGTASGPVSFMRGADSWAGTIKSGGKTRRAAKMVVLNVDHPDIREFIWCKAKEEDKAAALRDAGFDMSIDGDGFKSIQYQNANNSVRVTDEFMRAVEDDRDWRLISRTTGEPIGEPVSARELMREIAEAAHRCADPGMQYDTTINRWHTSPNSGRINASNPCCFVGDTAVRTTLGDLTFDQLYGMSASGEQLPSVEALDVQDNERVVRGITSVWVTGMASRLTRIELADGTMIRCTPEHRFLSVSGEWLAAETLTASTQIRATEDRAVGDAPYLVKALAALVVSRVTTEDLSEPVPVFDMEVEGVHNFVIACAEEASGVVVHNSEYMHVDNSACNLASLNLMKFRRPDGTLDVESFEHAVDVVLLAQEIVVGPSSYPTEQIGANARAFRQLGLGYTNLGAYLMSDGMPYDSEEGRATAAAITALMTGRGYRRSAEVASALGPYERYAENREPHNNVMRMHRDASYTIDNDACTDSELLNAARRSWDEAVELGELYGYRNAQATVLAPTGTISFLLDADTTGVEPDFSLVKFKELVGGGQMTIVNKTVPLALQTLGYAEQEVEQIEAYLAEHGTIVGAPGLNDEHLSVFDVAVGERAISHMGHIKMMGAVQPSISGALSKTINMPQEATVEDIADAYLQAWHLGIKALAIYRDGSKTAQALRTDAQKAAPADVDAIVEQAVSKALAEAGPRRKRMPRERQSITHKFSIGGHEGYITAGMYPDGSVGEIFLTDIGKEGSTLRGMMNSFATAISIALQYGVPLETLVQKFSYMRFEPEGITGNPEIPFAKSMPDYIMRWLASRFLDTDAQEELGILTPEVRARKMAQEAAQSMQGSDTAGPSATDDDSEGAAPQASAGATGQSTPAAASFTDSPPVVPARLRGLDLGPACGQCGGMMQRTGSCYTCSSCGNNTGCG